VIINVDMDGVVYDMVTQAEVLRKKPFERYTWDLGLTGTELKAMFTELTLAGLFRFGMAIEGALPAIRKLRGAGHRVRIVTDKNLPTAYSTHVARIDTLDWLHISGLADIEVIFTGNKAEGYPADLVIDDKPDLAWVQGGAVNVLFDQPWNLDGLGKVAGVNEEPNFPDVMNLRRAFGWTDVLELVEQMGGGILQEKVA
jgi:hypothetical protein